MLSWLVYTVYKPYVYVSYALALMTLASHLAMLFRHTLYNATLHDDYNSGPQNRAYVLAASFVLNSICGVMTVILNHLIAVRYSNKLEE